MGRNRRTIIENGLYHVVVEGAGNIDLFVGRKLKYDLRSRVSDCFIYAKDFDNHQEIELLSYVATKDTLDMIIKVNDGNIGKAMHLFNSELTRKFKKKTAIKGQVIKPGYRSKPIASKFHLVVLMDYIHSNAKRNNLSSSYEYEYSSYSEIMEGKEGEVNFNEILSALELDQVQLRMVLKQLEESNIRRSSRSAFLKSGTYSENQLQSESRFFGAFEPIVYGLMDDIKKIISEEKLIDLYKALIALDFIPNATEDIAAKLIDPEYRENFIREKGNSINLDGFVSGPNFKDMTSSPARYGAKRPAKAVEKMKSHLDELRGRDIPDVLKPYRAQILYLFKGLKLTSSVIFDIFVISLYLQSKSPKPPLDCYMFQLKNPERARLRFEKGYT